MSSGNSCNANDNPSLIKLDSSGNIKFIKLLTHNLGYIDGLDVDNQKSIYVTGYTDMNLINGPVNGSNYVVNPIDGNYDGPFVQKFDNHGNHSFTKVFPTFSHTSWLSSNMKPLVIDNLIFQTLSVYGTSADTNFYISDGLNITDSIFLPPPPISSINQSDLTLKFSSTGTLLGYFNSQSVIFPKSFF